MPDRAYVLVIVEDHQMLADSLGAWLTQQADFTLAGSARDGEEGWKLCLAKRPDVVLVDVEMPKLDGLELAERLLAEMPKLRIMAMSGQCDPHTILRVSRSGVHGFLEKTQSPDLLVEAVRTVARGGTYFSPVFDQVRRDSLQQPAAYYKVLSDREQTVLKLVAAGWDDDRIALQLGISGATVSAHRKHIRQKLELHNDRDLVGYARKWGLDRMSPQL